MIKSLSQLRSLFHRHFTLVYKASLQKSPLHLERTLLLTPLETQPSSSAAAKSSTHHEKVSISFACHRACEQRWSDDVRRAFDGDQMRLPDDRAGQPVRAVVEGGHELVLRVERHLGPAGQRLAGLLGVHAHLRGQHHERRLGRVADDRPVVADGGIGAQHQAQGQVAEVGRLRPGHAQDRAGLGVAGAFDLEPVTAAQHGGRGHRVHRQRAGLVAVDDGGPAQGLHVRQRLDHRLVLSQPPRPRRQHGLHERGQPGRDRRDRGGDAQQHQRGGVLAPHQAEDGDDRHGDERDRPEHLGHAVQFALQRRLGPLGGGDHPGDLAHLGRAAGGGHHDRRGAPGDLGVLEHQVGPVAQRHLTLGQRARVLGYRRALPGQRGLLHLQRGRGRDPPVRRDHVPGLQQHDVTRHQRGRFDLLDLPGAPHPGMRHLQLGQRLHAGPGLQLLGRAHHHVERHQPQHHQRRGDLDDREAGRDHDQQHDVHRVDQLGPGHHPHARRRLGRYLVRPVLLQPPLRLVGVQPVIRIDTHLPGRGFRRQGVPGEVLGGLLHGGHLSSSGRWRLTRAAAAGLVRELDIFRPGVAEVFPSVVQGHAQHQDARQRGDRCGLVDQSGEHERHEDRAGRDDRQDQHQEVRAGLGADPQVRRGDHGEDHQGHRAADRRDRVQVEHHGQDQAHRRLDQQPVRGPPAGLARHHRRELSRLGQPLGQPLGRVQARVGGPGGGEQRGDGHQPVARPAQRGLGGHRDRGPAGGDHLVHRERAEHAQRDGDVDDRGDPQRQEHRLGQLAGRLGQVLGGEGDDAEAQEGEEGQRHAGDDVLERRVPGERQQRRVNVHERDHREEGQDPQHHVDDHRLRTRPPARTRRRSARSSPR